VSVHLPFSYSNYSHENNLCNCSASAQSDFTFHQNPIVSTGRWKLKIVYTKISLFPPSFDSFHHLVETIGHFPPFGGNDRTLSTGRRPTSQKVKTIKKYHIYFAARQTHTKKRD
jgi:hypothetical protein